MDAPQPEKTGTKTCGELFRQAVPRRRFSKWLEPMWPLTDGTRPMPGPALGRQCLLAV